MIEKGKSGDLTTGVSLSEEWLHLLKGGRYLQTFLSEILSKVKDGIKSSPGESVPDIFVFRRIPELSHASKIHHQMQYFQINNCKKFWSAVDSLALTSV